MIAIMEIDIPWLHVHPLKYKLDHVINTCLFCASCTVKTLIFPLTQSAGSKIGFVW